MKAVFANTGGIESTVLAYALARKGYDLHALIQDFGTNGQEVTAAINTCKRLGIAYDTINMDGLLIGGAKRDLFVPTVISYGLYFSQGKGASELYIGYEKDQIDKNREILRFLEAFPKLIDVFDPDSQPVALRTPFTELSKAEVIRLGNDLGVPLDKTWSCSQDEAIQCGRCRNCLKRRAAFKAAGVIDTTPYKEMVY